MDIQLFRIDDRLIHGQVVIGWAGYLHSEQIILCDDSVAANDWEKELYLSVVPEQIRAMVFSVNGLTEHLLQGKDDYSKTIIVINSPQIIEHLLQAGVRLKTVNVGGIHFKEGRKKYLPYLYLSEDEVHSFKRCMEKGVNFECQDMPATRVVPLGNLLEKNINE